MSLRKPKLKTFYYTQLFVNKDEGKGTLKQRDKLKLFVQREILWHIHLTIILCLVILFSTDEIQGARWQQWQESRQQRGVWAGLTFLFHSSVFRSEWDWICLKYIVPPHGCGTTQGDLFIWLLPSKLACPRDRWPLCPSSRQAVSLSSTKQLEGQLCGDPSYSLSLFLLLFTLSLSLLPPYHLLSIPRITPSLLDSHIFPALSIFSIFFPASCWSADANWESDLCKFNLNNGGILQCICVHYAWVPMQSCEDESSSHPLFCLSQSLAGWPRLYLAWSCTHTGVPPAGPCSPKSDHRCEGQHVHWTERENTDKTPAQ